MKERHPEDLLTITDVVEELQNQVTKQTVSKWCRKGLIPTQRAGRKWLIRYSDLTAFLNTGGENSTKKADGLAYAW